MDVIRCDEPADYLIWKWSPGGEASKKENAIRYGSSVRVKDGEVAVFVYKQRSGLMQDFIVGPYDETIKTANFPVLTSIVGSAFGGNSPFQAEIYFINLAGNVRMPFFIPRVNITDPRNDDYPVPAAVKGSLMFNISDYQNFIKLNKLIDFSIEDFFDQIKDPLTANVSSLVGRSARECKFSVFRVDSYLLEISQFIENALRQRVEHDYGVNIKQVNIAEINLDEEHPNFERLDKILKGRAELIADEQTMATVRNVEDIRIMDLDLRARANEEMQRAQKLQTENTYIGAHQINIQGEVAKTAAESLGQLGGSGGMNMDFGGGGGGMNPAAMMTGMMMGTAVGGSMSNMMGNMMQGVNTPQPPPPPVGATASYHISNHGQQAGPYTLAQLQQMVVQGGMTKSTHVWKQGMSGWLMAEQVPEIAQLFGAVPPPPPAGMPGTPPPPPAGL